ncbi:MAG TPA: FtsW/RodA/SpoVE family cell cycle protein [Candidatus Onthousia faecavium]|nr:FtsW/RodA/SpoVE family cell cycle protein [Candidatus Onthousia faecavium]
MYKRRKLDLTIIIPLILFFIISITSIYSAMTYMPSENGNLALKQVMWYGIGIILIIILWKLKNRYLYRNAWFFYIICNILLLSLLLFAPEINNSKCWFVIPYIGSFQPSEFTKISIMLVLSCMIAKFRERTDHPSIKEEAFFIFKTLVVVLIPSILTFLEPDTGSVIIYLVIYVFMMFTSGIRLRWFLIIGLISLTLMGSVILCYYFNEDLFVSIFGTDLYYRFDRILDWRSGSGLQLENALAAIGSAGVFGHGFNNTPIYFPESGTDFIFAVFASNFGLFGALILIAIIVFFDTRLVIMATKKIPICDKFVLAGIIGMLLFQQVQNIGMTLGLLPITGITLPFISYGGSSLLSYMIIVGIILNISGEKKSRN